MRDFSHEGFTFDVTDTQPTTAGAGETVVLLHGFPQDRHSWDAITPALAAAGYRVLAPDQRGYSPGARPKPRRAYTLPHLAGDVLALADAAGAQRFHLVGHDWGAGLAWYIAAQHPDRMISVAALSVPHLAALIRSMFRSDQALRSWYMAVFQLPAAPEWAFSRRGGDVLRRTLVRYGLDADRASRYAARAVDPTAMRGPVNWYRGLPFSLRERFGNIKVRTLFLWGDRDPHISRAAAESCGRYVTGPYRFETLPASHWLPEQAPNQVADLLLSHLAG